MKFSVADSDRPYSGASNPRADFETAAYFTNGSDLYYSTEFLIPSSFPTLTGKGWVQLSEIYGPPHGGSPPLGIGMNPGANGRPQVNLSRGAAQNYDRPWHSPTLDAGWHQIVVHTRSAPDSSGFVQLWFDGQPQTFSNGQTQLNYATLAPGVNWDGHTANVLNVNFYRQAGTYPGTVTMYQAAAKVGTTLASVMATTPPPPPPPPPLQAAFTAPPTSGVGATVAFDASSSTGAPGSYRWTDGTHTLGTGETMPFTFHYVGTKHVTLTVTNASGATSSVEHDLTVS